MAKKTISKVKGNTSKNMVKLILPLKSAATGSYAFRQEMLPTEEVEKRLSLK